MFDFFDGPMLKALRKNDFVSFARRYNGSGKAQSYGQKIRRHYKVFKNLKTRQTNQKEAM
jgi:hypothetical protein